MTIFAYLLPAMLNQAAPVDPLLAALKTLPLWNHFEEVATVEQRATVRGLLSHADALLARVVETFPTYTLHDRTHAINVARLMGELAGPFLPRMNALEAGLLLLSAFWHDVGMVFSEEERATISETEEFQEFLRAHPEAQLEVVAEGNVSRAVAEWYCRASHAERVFLHLEQVENELKWDGIPFRQQLGDLCRSHNLDAARLKRDDLCPTKFLGVADVRFCAILLRLADILDFDRTRSPDAIYRYLGIGRRANSRERASDVEWRKHLSSTGFAFPALKERSVPYPLTFVAAPDAPAVEWDVRHFLNGIEGEILECRQLVFSCSPRWRDHVLPTRIEGELHSQNYTFGDYRFLLEQEQVLGLLMGENLYRDPHVFTRELLQNALDTSRHREFHERARGNVNFKCEPIVVSEWYDHEHYHWVRFDDYGMGMTEEIVRNFLLRVGRSYYTSAEFKAGQLGYDSQNRFTPISRFGIGLLSCFISGDRVEINTRHAVHAKSKTDSIRLSLVGLHGFFTLQTGTHIPKPMPAEAREEPGYRIKPGTSIAVRLNPGKERGEFDVGRSLRSYLLYPPVPVRYKDVEIGGNPAELEVPWLEQPFEEEINAGQMRLFIDELAADPTTRLSIRVLPIDLSSNASSGKLRGQLVETELEVRSSYLDAESRAGIRRTYSLSIDSGGLKLKSEIGFSSTTINALHEEVPPEVAEHLSRVKALFTQNRKWISREIHPVFGVEKIRRLMDLHMKGYGPRIRLAHNGIAFTYSEGPFGLDRPLRFDKSGKFPVVGGTVLLFDELRPDLSVSRDHVAERLPWNACLSLELAYRHASKNVLPATMVLLWEGYPRSWDTALGDLADEPSLSKGSGWWHERIFRVLTKEVETYLSAQDLSSVLGNSAAEMVISPTGVIRDQHEDWSLLECVERVILARDFNPVLLLSNDSDDSYEIHVAGIRTTPLLPGELLFPPLTFIPFRDSEALVSRRGDFINATHPLAEWLLKASPRLAQRFPGFLRALRGGLVFTLPRFVDEQINEFNRITDRLRGIDPQLAPPPSLRLRPDDFA